MESFGKDFGKLSQGDNKTKIYSMGSIFVMERHEIKNIPKDGTITYSHVVVGFRQRKEDPKWVCITAGGNIITYPSKISTHTADITTSKIICNSVVSTENAKYMCVDIKNFYLGNPLYQYKYMHIPLILFTGHVIEQYKLRNKDKNGFIYMEIRKSIYGLPQTGNLSEKLLTPHE